MPNKKQTKQCAIYVRVSTDAQAKKDFSSCQSQEEKIKSFIASQNNWQIAKVYSDAGFTGANTNRPALQELFNDIKQNKVDIILSYKIDRLTRSPKDFYQLIEFFEQNDVSFISITERFDTSTPSGRLLRNIMLTFAQFERELASERTRDKMLERAKKGLYNGGFAPYGYERKNKKLFINKKEAKIVELIFDTYIETDSLAKTYYLLKDKKIRNRNGNLMQKTVLGFLLRNPVYAGKVKHKDKLYQGIHKPIISKEVFELAQSVHKKKNDRKFRVYRDFLLGGLMECQECGYKMSSVFTNKHKQGNLTRYYYYRCNSTTHKDWQACSTRQVSADRLEKYLLENLERISVDENYIENLVFKLNHSFNAGLSAGYEPSKVCSKFSGFEPKVITSLLKSFLMELKNKKGIERNLLAKKFIQKILYSKQSIKITLFYAENPKDFQKLSSQNNTAPFDGGGAKNSELSKEKSVFALSNEFVAFNTAAGLGFEPR